MLLDPRAVGMFVAAMFASVVMTRLWIAVARASKIEDAPGQRRLHAATTPRGGGLAIALTFVAALAYLSAAGGDSSWAWLAGGIAAFAAVGLFDDLFPVPTWAKFLSQIGAASLLVLGVTSAWGLEPILTVVLVLACTYVVNIWNFMDGSDGLVSVQAFLLALSIALWPSQDAALSLAALSLAGACLGFLPFNFPRARVFLGDVGSHALGAAIFGLCLLAWQNGSIGWAQLLLMGSVLLLDSGLTLLRRALAGRRVWTAHREHLYQYAVRVGHSHARVCILYGAVTIAAVAMAQGFGRLHSSWVMAGVLIFSWMSGTLVYLALRDRWLDNTHRGRGNG